MSRGSLLIGLLLFCSIIIGEEIDELRFLEIEMITSPSYDNYFKTAIHRLVQGDLTESIELFEGIKIHVDNGNVVWLTVPEIIQTYQKN